MKTYADIKKAIATCRAKQQEIVIGKEESIRRASEALAQEQEKEKNLLAELASVIKADLGEEVTIGKVPLVNKPVSQSRSNIEYDRARIISRIIDLRRDNMSFMVIADTLNSEGYKPMTADKFRSASIFQMYQKEIKTNAEKVISSIKTT